MSNQINYKSNDLLKHSNMHNQLTNNKMIDIDLSFLDSDSDYDDNKIGGSTLDTDTEQLSTNTEEFVNLLKSKISSINSKQERSFSETSNFSETSPFMTATQQIGGKYTDTDYDIDAITNIAKNYLKQYGGASSDNDSDDDLDDSEDSDDSDDDDDDDDDSESSKSSKSPKKEHKSKRGSGSGKKQHKPQKNHLSKSQILNLSESIDESTSSQSYRIGSNESFGTSTVSDTPYKFDTESLNTSSINLVSFENPALTINKNLETTNKKKKKTKTKRQTKY